jgi:hypothetical protein
MVKPRFGLKLLFVLMTVLAVVGGSWAARRQAAARAAARHNAVVKQLLSSLAMPPRGTKIVTPGRPQRFRPIKERTDDDFLNNDPRNVASMSGVTLDLTGSWLQNTPAALTFHYETGLAKLGLSRTNSSSNDREARVLWIDHDNDLHVLIDVAVDQNTLGAHVQVMFIDSQKLSVW